MPSEHSPYTSTAFEEKAMADSPSRVLPQGLRPTREYLVPAEELEKQSRIGEAQQVSLATSKKLRIFAIIINFLVVTEVFVAMFFASQTPDRLTPIFFTILFSQLVPTLLLAFFGRRHLAKAGHK
jgi:hypothetical protein